LWGLVQTGIKGLVFINVKSTCGFLLVALNAIDKKKENSCVIKRLKLYNIKKLLYDCCIKRTYKIANANILLKRCYRFAYILTEKAY
jgi:hypothetical protein